MPSSWTLTKNIPRWLKRLWRWVTQWWAEPKVIRVDNSCLRVQGFQLVCLADQDEVSETDSAYSYHYLVSVELVLKNASRLVRDWESCAVALRSTTVSSAIRARVWRVSEWICAPTGAATFQRGQGQSQVQRRLIRGNYRCEEFPWLARKRCWPFWKRLSRAH